jgi:predicted nuclease of predicted toxin-antitoxin system
VKVIIDENLPPALAKALDALFAGEHEVVHLRAKFGPSVSDVEWISQLSAEGRWVVISGDARITRNRAERAAFRNSRLIGFFLAAALNKSKTTKQMQRLLERWDDIEATVGLIAGGAMYELPIKGKIRQLKTS